MILTEEEKEKRKKYRDSEIELVKRASKEQFVKLYMNLFDRYINALDNVIEVAESALCYMNLYEKELKKSKGEKSK